jgi:hypothetical protein
VIVAGSSTHRATAAQSSRPGLTFEQLLERVGGNRTTLRHVLRSELVSGHVLQIADRYVLNGKLPEDVKRALLSLGLVHERR